MAIEREKKSKATAAPLCKNCDKRHWGVCANQSPMGAISAQAPKAGSSVTAALETDLGKWSASTSTRKRVTEAQEK